MRKQGYAVCWFCLAMEVTTHLVEGWVGDVGRCRYQECLQLSIGQIQPEQDWGAPESVVGKGPPFLLFLNGMGWLVCCRERVIALGSPPVLEV